MEIQAAERVAAGEELFWAYHAGHARIDSALLIYGMVNESDTRLAAVDLPQYVCSTRRAPCPRAPHSCLVIATATALIRSRAGGK